MPQLSGVEAQALEREYLAHRGPVLRILRSEFRGLSDLEELYQEAWTEALELQARGEEIINLPGLLVTIARRRAIDRLRHRSATPLDPTGGVIPHLRDEVELPDEQVEVKIETDVIRHVVESLEPREAA